MTERSMAVTGERGFSLIELVMAMVVFAIGAVLTMQAFIPPARAILVDTEIQLATDAAQACAEHLLGLRQIQTNGWNTVPAAGNTLCDSITLPTGYTRNLSIVAVAAGASGGIPCLGTFLPAATSCRQVTITVGKTGGEVPPVIYTFMMINY